MHVQRRLYSRQKFQHHHRHVIIIILLSHKSNKPQGDNENNSVIDIRWLTVHGQLTPENSPDEAEASSEIGSVSGVYWASAVSAQKQTHLSIQTHIVCSLFLQETHQEMR